MSGNSKVSPCSYISNVIPFHSKEQFRSFVFMQANIFYSIVLFAERVHGGEAGKYGIYYFDGLPFDDCAAKIIFFPENSK